MKKLSGIQLSYVIFVLRQNGGPGSGNFGHAGRPGKVGGSAPASTPTSRYTKDDVDFGYYKDNISEVYLQKLEDRFELFSRENDGEEFDFIEEDGEPIAFLQRTGSRIYYIQSLNPGAGKALIERAKEEFDFIVADNVLPGAERWWKEQGFTKTDNYHGGGYDWEWFSS